MTSNISLSIPPQGCSEDVYDVDFECDTLRRCVACCGFRRWYALHIFVESFQEQYKDGTDGTWDFRMVSASFLILRILTMATFANRYYSYRTLSGVQCLLFASTVCFYAVVRPYKLNFRNNVDICVLFMVRVFSGILLVATFHPASKAPFMYFALGTGLVLYMYSTHDISVVHLLLVGNKGRHHSIPAKKRQNFEKLCMDYQTRKSS